MEFLTNMSGHLYEFVSNLTNAELYSYIIILSTALIFSLLERAFPYKEQKFLRKGFFNDLVLYTIAQSYILGIIIFTFIIYYIDTITGLSRLQLFADTPIWLQLVFFTLTHDLYIYLMHRWQHKNKYLWRLHEAHHSPDNVDWLAGSRSHAFEILINQTIEFLPIILLGSPPEVIAYKGVISAVWGMYIHSNINITTGPLQYVINGPEMHRWHHTTGKGRNRNFATKLAIWDWLFGTAYLPLGDKVDQYGLKTAFPDNFFRQFIFAFRCFSTKKKSE
ncbi:MAG: sterol desaturase family protein [Bacteroidetes bacterium]|nr:sterol desaturase family protein [Bacteroidota bacterium]